MMTLKELSQFYYLQKEIEDLNNRIILLKEKATDTSVKLSGMPKGSAPGDKLGKIVGDIDFYEQLLKKRKIKCKKELEKLNNYISDIEDSFTRQIFAYRFIDRCSWSQIAAKLKTSVGAAKMTVYRYIRKHK